MVFTAAGPDGRTLSPGCIADPNTLCLFSQTGYNGKLYQFGSEGYIQNLAAYGVTHIGSFKNRRSHRWFLHEFANGKGRETCYQANTTVSSLGPWYSNGKSIYLAETNNPC